MNSKSISTKSAKWFLESTELCLLASKSRKESANSFNNKRDKLFRKNISVRVVKMLDIREIVKGSVKNKNDDLNVIIKSNSINKTKNVLSIFNESEFKDWNILGIIHKSSIFIPVNKSLNITLEPEIRFGLFLIMSRTIIISRLCRIFSILSNKISL